MLRVIFIEFHLLFLLKPKITIILLFNMKQVSIENVSKIKFYKLKT